MKMGSMFELSQAQLTGAAHLPPFDNLVFHQCPNPQTTAWAWAKLVWHISTSNWGSAKLWRSESLTTKIWVTSPICIEDAHFDCKYGSWINYRYDFAHWRDIARQQLGEHLPEAGPRCAARTGLRIRVFERTSGQARRTFTNLEEVVAAAQMFTTLPVSMMSTNETQTVIEQIAQFNSFDILITPHGSHIANILFSPLGVVIIEVVPMIRDPAFQRNSISMGFSGYIVSTGHRVAPTCAAAPKQVQCTPANTTHDVRCTHAISQALTNCDTVVDIPKLDAALIQAVDKLCPASAV